MDSRTQIVLGAAAGEAVLGKNIGNKDYISMDSPMAQSLLDKKVGDEVIVETKIAKFTWKINSIEYQKN